MSDEKNWNYLHFKISSALKSFIGKDLITNDFIAVFELVKNSIDANASEINIVFEDCNGLIDRIYIIDNGKGMTYQELLDKWLFVGYSAKSDGSEDSDLKKKYAGNKGVGRFSCDRLGQRLKLQTRSKNSSDVNIIEVDWSDFDYNSKINFESVEIKHRLNDCFEINADYYQDSASGVILEISGLRDPESWDRSKLKKLKNNISKLINPFGDHNESAIINIICKRELPQDNKLISDLGIEYNKDVDLTDSLINSKVSNNIFDILYNKTASINVEIDSSGTVNTVLFDRGELIYKISESTVEFSLLTGSDFKCKIFFLNQSAKSLFKRRTGIHSVQFGSLFLFRNGFRVMPIGDENDDTWGVDRRHQQGYSRTLGTRDIMGRIDIFGSETEFKEKSSRDGGLVETEASKQLFDFVTKKCIRRLEQYVVNVNWKDSIDKLHLTSERLYLDSNRTNIIDLVSKLSETKDVQVIEYNSNLVNVLNEKSDFFEYSAEKLSKLAKSAEDYSLIEEIQYARKRFNELKKSEAEAISWANKELEARLEAEKKAAIEEKLRVNAEKRAETETILKDKAQKEVKIISNAYEQEKKRNLFLLKNENRDVEQLESFLHQIVIYSAAAKQKITSTILKIKSEDSVNYKEFILDSLGEIHESVDKVMTTSRFATTANFKLDSTKITADLAAYTTEYLEKISTAYNSRIQIRVINTSGEFISKFTPIELGMIFDNLVSNSKKARSSLVVFELKIVDKNILSITVSDNGKGLSDEIIEKNRIFEKGVTTTRGSGLGLYHCKKQIEKMGGEIFISEVQPQQGFSIEIRLKR